MALQNSLELLYVSGAHMAGENFIQTVRGLHTSGFVVLVIVLRFFI